MFCFSRAMLLEFKAHSVFAISIFILWLNRALFVSCMGTNIIWLTQRPSEISSRQVKKLCLYNACFHKTKTNLFHLLKKPQKQNTIDGLLRLFLINWLWNLLWEHLSKRLNGFFFSSRRIQLTWSVILSKVRKETAEFLLRLEWVTKRCQNQYQRTNTKTPNTTSSWKN